MPCTAADNRRKGLRLRQTCDSLLRPPDHIVGLTGLDFTPVAAPFCPSYSTLTSTPFLIHTSMISTSLGLAFARRVPQHDIPEHRAPPRAPG